VHVEELERRVLRPPLRLQLVHPVLVKPRVGERAADVAVPGDHPRAAAVRHRHPRDWLPLSHRREIRERILEEASVELLGSRFRHIGQLKI